MGRELTFESVMLDLDRILEMPQSRPRAAIQWLRKLDQDLEVVLAAARIDEPRRRSLLNITTSLRASAAELAQSLARARMGGPMRGDWTRFAERDFSVLKDELLGLREFMTAEADFLRFVCLRDRLGELGGTNPEKLFEELHDAGAISERTWLLLMTRPGSWQDALKDKEISKQLAQISAWLLDLQEAKKEREALEKVKTAEGVSDEAR